MDAYISKLVVVFVTISLCVGQQSSWYSFLSCSYILKTDCYNYGTYPECGSNGITYRNRCDFSKAHCDDKNLHVAHYGDCKATDRTTPGTTSGGTNGVTSGVTNGVTVKPVVTSAATMAPSTPDPLLAGSEAVLDFFCLQISHSSCGTESEPICASDNVTYQNGCEFEKQKCTHRELTAKSFGESC